MKILSINTDKRACVFICTIISCSFIYLSSAYERMTTIENNFSRVPLELDANSYGMTFSEEVDHFSEVLVDSFKIDKETALKYSGWIIESNAYTNVPESILASVVMTESNFKDDARSHKNAVGPAQIIYKYWRDECPSDTETNPRSNVLCAGVVLNNYYENNCNYSSWDCALKMYNVGPAAYRKDYKSKLSARRYLKKIDKQISLLSKANLHASYFH